MISTYTQLGELAEGWNALALSAGAPFMSCEWQRSWAEAFGGEGFRWTVLHDADGSIRACTCVVHGARRLASSTNVHSPDWDVLARDSQSRAELIDALVAARDSRVSLQGLRADSEAAQLAERALSEQGYRVAPVPGPFSPWLSLPDSFEQLEADSSSSLRSQVRRRRRGLEREGQLTFRVSGGPDSLADDLETFLALEASGWKGRDGTAIVSKPSTDKLYRGYAEGAAAQGWLRLYMLELDGEAIAADFGIAFAGTGVFVKTGFDESRAKLSPGLVLRAEVLRSSVEEGLTGYDFLGDPDTYKTRWTADTRPRVSLWAYRGEALPGYAYRRRLRPLLKQARNRALDLRSRVGTAGG
ncbi:MAG TPA: GNAT family N-acetyltransferase [Solirubrobacteraceae bacterium]|jgi:CelD/BcsL family acetyltransferase involved in cellulose biosynthesis|nr:GNAT family N-acetyltransferase [Solirubrobacteraceae bacterium]